MKSKPLQINRQTSEPDAIALFNLFPDVNTIEEVGVGYAAKWKRKVFEQNGKLNSTKIEFPTMPKMPDLNPDNNPRRQVIINRLIDGVLINRESELLASCQTAHEADLCYLIICDDWMDYSPRESEVDYRELQAGFFIFRPITQVQMNAFRFHMYRQYTFEVPDQDHLAAISSTSVTQNESLSTILSSSGKTFLA